MEFLERLVTVNYHYALAHFQPGGPYGLPSILCTLLFAWGIFAWRRRQRGRRADLRLFVRALFPRKIVLHRSSFVDLRLWVLNIVVLGVAYTSLAISGLAVRNGVISGFTHMFGEHAPTAWPVRRCSPTSSPIGSAIICSTASSSCGSSTRFTIRRR